jgi:hypothetical protein
MKHLVISLCFTLCILLALSMAAMAAEDPAAGEAQLALNAAQALVDQQLSNVEGSLTVLATTLEVQSLDWDTMQPLLAAFQEHSAPGVVWFAMPDGTYYTADNGQMEQTLSDRVYFEPLMSGEDILGEIVTSKSSGQHSAVVAVPVYLEGQVMGALGLSVFTERMAEKLAAAQILPKGMGLLVADVNAQPVFSLPTAGPRWSEDRAALEAALSSGAIELEDGGAPVAVVGQVSDLNGWRYLIILPQD